MPDTPTRKQLIAQFKQNRPEAGVYRIVNSRTGKALLGASTNLASVRNKIEFAKSTGSLGTLDHRLRPDVQRFGIEVLSVEVLDVLESKPEMTDADNLADLAVLEQLWRERLDAATLY